MLCDIHNYIGRHMGPAGQDPETIEKRTRPFCNETALCGVNALAACALGFASYENLFYLPCLSGFARTRHRLQALFHPLGRDGRQAGSQDPGEGG